MRAKFPDNTFVSPKEGWGNRLVVAEAPGEEESIKGEPLVGGSGRFFDVMASKAGVKRAELTIINTIQCRPPDNVYPTDAAARKYISKDDAHRATSQCYRNHVVPVLRSRHWERIDILGEKPLTTLCGKYGVSHWSGSPLAVPDSLDPGKTLAVPTFHPAYIARDQSMLPKVVNDLAKGNVPPPEHYDLYPSLDKVQAFDAKEFAIDIESDIKTGKIFLVGLSSKLYHSMTVPFKGAYIGELQRIFRNAEVIIGHNILQFDLPKLREEGVSFSGHVWDTMLLQHLCFPDFPHDLEFVSSQFTQKPAWKDEARGTGYYWELRCCRDVDVTLQSHQQLLPMLRGFGMESLYSNVQVPLALICREMHLTGFKIDPARIQYVRTKFLGEMQTEEAQLPPEMRTHMVPTKKRAPAPAGTLGKSGKPVKFIMVDAEEEVVPWRSAKQKQEYLYGSTHPWQLGLPPQRDIKSGNITTGKIALDKLYGKTRNRALKALRILNQLDELLSTFAKDEMRSVSRLYPHFNVHGTSSGRLSSADPNLQNIPESARYIYVPSDPDWQLVSFDYSQIENRLTAYFAGDSDRLARFAANKDFSEHKHAASLFMGIPYEEVPKDNSKDAPYGKAKRIVHSTNYGAGPRKIANLFDMDFKETKDLQTRWKKEIWATIKWQEECAERAKRDGSLTTPFGRMRWFYTSSYFTEALSFLPQSTAADCIFRAMIGLMYERIGWPVERALRVCEVVEPLPRPARLLIQVHDALVFETPREILPSLIDSVSRVMQQPWRALGGFSIPVGIEVAEPGESWGEMKKYVAA